MVLAPALMALSTQRHMKSWSVREPSSHDHSTSSVKPRARLTLSITASCTASASSSSLYFMCSALVEMKVWMRPRLAGLMASAQRSMSMRVARASPQMTDLVTVRAIWRTASKSPSEAIGKPASITSTPIFSRALAMRIFSSRFMDAPGDCSPSRSVVSNITTRSESSVLPESFDLLI